MHSYILFFILSHPEIQNQVVFWVLWIFQDIRPWYNTDSNSDISLIRITAIFLYIQGK